MSAAPPIAPLSRPSFPWLTALRGLFAVWIILNHLGSPAFGPAPWIDEWLHVVRLRAFDLPTTGFFILSGIIFGSGRQPTPDFRGALAFWRARLARIYPIYLLALAACAPRGWAKAGGDIPTFLLSGLAEALFLQGWVTDTSWYVLWNPVGWFMSCIALCYLVFPWVSRWALAARGAWALAAVGLAAALVTDALGILTSHGALPGSHRDIRYFPPYCIPAFVLGCVTGALLARGTRAAAVSLAGGAAALAFLSLAIGFDSFAFCFMVLAGPLALVAVGLALAPGAPPKPLLRLGDIAFTLYMTHWALHLWMKHGALWLGIGGFYESAAGLALYLLVLLGLADWINLNFERPMQRLLDPRRSTPA